MMGLKNGEDLLVITPTVVLAAVTDANAVPGTLGITG